MEKIYVVNCCRTAIGSFGGALKDISAVKLGAIVIEEALKRAEISADNVDEVFMGCVLTAGLGQNVARQMAVGAGIGVEVPATTIGMVCGSGMKAIVEGARAILSGDAEIVVAGGAENMSAAPYCLDSGRWGARINDVAMTDTMVKDGLWDAFNDYHMAITAENICQERGISREELDEFAYESQMKAKAAQQSGRFSDEIVPVHVKQRKNEFDFAVDEYPRGDSSLEGLAKLKPSFKSDGKVTAGNASGINDGAAALVLASEEAVNKYGLKPMALLKDWAQIGVDPAIMGIGPVFATRKLMEKTGLTINDFDLIEANEAFAAHSIAVARDLGLDMSKVNVNGGAISLGHPIGCTGARIAVTLLYEMQKRDDAKLGLATLCIGGGMGMASLFEKV